MADLFDVDDLASFMRATLDDDAAEIARRVATSAIKAYLHPFDPTATGTQTAYLPIDRDGLVTLPPLLDAITSVTSVSDVALSYTHRAGHRRLVVTYPYLASNYQPGQYLEPEVKVTYTYTTVPDEIRDAALITAAAVYGPTTNAGGSAVGIDSETKSIDDYTHTIRYSSGSAVADPATSVPPDARVLLSRFRPPRSSVRLRAR